MGVVVMAACLHLGVTGAQAVYIGGLDGASNSSIFETSAITPLPNQGWTNVSGAARVFDTPTLNGTMIGTDPYANYAVEYATGVPVAALTTYTLDLDMGFVAGLAGGSADYSFSLGTLSEGTFTPLGEAKTGTITYGGNMASGPFSGSDNLVFTTDATVSGDQLAVQWRQTFQAGEQTGGSDYFGFDNVTLDATPVPEPSSVLLLAGLAAFAGLRRRRLA
jgi:hypothetical protein